MKNGGKKAAAIILGVVLAAACTVLCLILFTGIIFDSPLIGIGGSSYTGDKKYPQPGVNESVNEITVTYTGGTLYAGGVALRDNFNVEAVFEDGSSQQIDNYTCNILDDGTPLVEGSNTLMFKYGNCNAVLTVDAVNIRSFAYAPSYVTVAADEQTQKDIISRIEAGKTSYDQVYARVAFTGDSQIKALYTNELIPQNQITAEIGEGLDYFEKNYNEVISKASDKDVLVIHYGVNTLTTTEAGRAKFIEQYSSLIKRVQKDLPGIRIIVSGIFPVANTIVDQQPRFAYIGEYDYDLCEMCIELGVDYYSNNEYMISHQEVFGADGLHLTKAFYQDYWLKDMIITMGIDNE